MKTLLSTLLISILISCASIAQQQLVLPLASPPATVLQQVGLTEIKITYHRPSAKGRQVFGGLVPYDRMWRTGANSPTLLSLEDDVLLNGQPLPKGTYALFTIPQNSEQWMLIISKDTFSTELDALTGEFELFRLPIRAQTLESEYVETFTIGFENIRENYTDLVLSWERTKVFIPIEVEVQSKALNNIRNATRVTADNDWRTFASAANYLVDNKLEQTLAVKYVNRSLEINKNYYNYYILAKIQAWQDQYKEAYQTLQKAVNSGKTDLNYRYYETEIKELMQAYKGLMSQGGGTIKK